MTGCKCMECKFAPANYQEDGYLYYDCRNERSAKVTRHRHKDFPDFGCILGENRREVVITKNELLTAMYDELLADNKRLRTTLRAFIANVEEMSIGVGLPAIFYVCKDDQRIAVAPDKAESFYQAIMTKWHKDESSLIRTYDNYERQNYSLRKACEAAGDWLDKFCQAGRCQSGENDEVVKLFDQLSLALEGEDGAGSIATR